MLHINSVKSTASYDEKGFLLSPIRQNVSQDGAMSIQCIQSSEHYDEKGIAFVAMKETVIQPHALPIPIRSFKATDMQQLYNYQLETKNQSLRPLVVVLSFGGGLFGNVDNNTGLLSTTSEVHRYWQSLGLETSPETTPSVRIVTTGGAQNVPDKEDGGASLENTLDVEQVGAWCPNADIVLLIAPNSLDAFQNNLARALEFNATAVSCSWGFPERQASATYLQQANAKIAAIVQKGALFTAAAGDRGASDGDIGLNVDFPASSPFSVACAGTRLLSKTNTYNVSDLSQTLEVVWNNDSETSATGGGESKHFERPNYQIPFTGTTSFRSVGDIALNADPITGQQFLFANEIVVVGGTSIVAPIIAAAFAHRVNILGPSSSFHDYLYAVPRICYHDIITGNNGFFKAQTGYDPVSGLGSIDFSALVTSFTDKSSLVLPQPTSSTPPVVVVTPEIPLVTMEPRVLVLKNNRHQQLKLKASTSEGRQAGASSLWFSSDPNVATVSAHGKVTPGFNGTCTISNSSTQQTASVLVDSIVPVRSVSLMCGVPVGGSTKLLHATIQPFNATNPVLTWTSANPIIATVDSVTGVITGKKAGKVRISVNADIRGERKASFEIQVYDSLTAEI